jgi:hypothetical protein
VILAKELNKAGKHPREKTNILFVSLTNAEKQVSANRPRVWRRLERSIRKRRKQLLPLIGIEKNKTEKFNRVSILLEGLSKKNGNTSLTSGPKEKCG